MTRMAQALLSRKVPLSLFSRVCSSPLLLFERLAGRPGDRIHAVSGALDAAAWPQISEDAGVGMGIERRR